MWFIVNCLQIFEYELPEMVYEYCTFYFRIYERIGTVCCNDKSDTSVLLHFVLNGSPEENEGTEKCEQAKRENGKQ